MQLRPRFSRLRGLLPARARFLGELPPFAGKLEPSWLVVIAPRPLGLAILSAEQREKRFAAKFERGRKYIKDAFRGMPLPLEQVLVLQFASGNVRSIGGVRLVTVREFMHEMYEGLKGTSPASKAVPSNLPLLRTIQLAADAARAAPSEHRIIRAD